MKHELYCRVDEPVMNHRSRDRELDQAIDGMRRHHTGCLFCPRDYS